MTYFQTDYELSTIISYSQMIFLKLRMAAMFEISKCLCTCTYGCLLLSHVLFKSIQLSLRSSADKTDVRGKKKQELKQYVPSINMT